MERIDGCKKKRGSLYSDTMCIGAGQKIASIAYNIINISAGYGEKCLADGGESGMETSICRVKSVKKILKVLKTRNREAVIRFVSGTVC